MWDFLIILLFQSPSVSAFCVYISQVSCTVFVDKIILNKVLETRNILEFVIFMQKQNHIEIRQEYNL